MVKIASIEDLQQIKAKVLPSFAVRSDKDATKINTTPEIQIRLCRGSSCAASGASTIADALERCIKDNRLEKKVKLITTGCHGLCEMGPIVIVNPGNTLYARVKIEDIEEIVQQHILKGEIIEQLIYHDPITGQAIPSYHEIKFYSEQERRVLHNNGFIDPWYIDEYIARDGYQALAKALTQMKPEDVIAEIGKAGLRGRGGAGFPTATKWTFVRNAQGDEKYVVCNGDEGDPGAYMNRSVLEGNPHSIVEGMAISLCHRQCAPRLCIHPR